MITFQCGYHSTCIFIVCSMEEEKYKFKRGYTGGIKYIHV
jgi:hypothetical protein